MSEIKEKKNVMENQDGGQNEQEKKAKMAAKQQGKLWKGWKLGRYKEKRDIDKLVRGNMITRLAVRQKVKQHHGSKYVFANKYSNNNR